jgi:putative ABC transport system permease protein
MRERGLAEQPTLAVYLPAYGSGADHMYFAIHTTASKQALIPMIRTILSGIDRDLPLATVQTLEELVAASTSTQRFTVILLGAFALLALVLALVGIYGVMSYSVSRQTAEIGVRMALGASRERVLRFIIVRGMKPVIIGLAVGIAAALALSRVLAGLLFGVTAYDPLTYVAVAALLTTMALLACILPALQAMRIDLVSALRAE